MDVEAIEIRCLLEAVRLACGYDFREYGEASIRRRVRRCVSDGGYESVSHLQRAILTDPAALRDLIEHLSVTATEMFRDPEVYLALRERVLPYLSSFPVIRVWAAGCASGEEVYSLAILLREEGLIARSRIYATDFNPDALARAREGIFSIDRIREYTRNYQQAGGVLPFTNYYTARYDSAILSRELRENVTFAEHNLATDSVFAECQLILCRNVLIYFKRGLQSRVLSLFRDSLCRGGVLCLGTKETMRFAGCASDFEPVEAALKIFRKKAAS